MLIRARDSWRVTVRDECMRRIWVKVRKRMRQLPLHYMATMQIYGGCAFLIARVNGHPVKL